MVIDMNEAQVRTLEQVRQVVAGTQALQFKAAQDDEGRYGWIDAVLRRFDYRPPPNPLQAHSSLESRPSLQAHSSLEKTRC